MSSSTSTTPSDRAEVFGERWNRFWFTPADPLPAAVLRIVIGLLAAAHFVDLGRSLSLWYASDGALPPAAVGRLLKLTGGDPAYHVTVARTADPAVRSKAARELERHRMASNPVHPNVRGSLFDLGVVEASKLRSSCHT